MARAESGEFELVPNCLLTRWPIVFMTGLRSPFYFRNYWNRIPLYLREHGYEVVEHDLPWRNSAARKSELELFLSAAQNQNLRFHFIFDATSVADSEWLAAQRHPVVASNTMVTDVSLGLCPATVKDVGINQALALYCHRFYLPKGAVFNPASLGLGSRLPELQVEKEFLRLAISLAEKDMSLHSISHELHR
jgi:hypothetical protein